MFDCTPLSEEELHSIWDWVVDQIASGGISSFDGVMSAISVEIAARLGTTAFDMNSWWVKTPPDWTCPACGRAKIDIARRNTKGEAMCHLVEHHDHMRDVLKRRFTEISAGRKSVVADELSERFAKRSAAMVAAYDNTIICEDCNNADVLAKKAAGTHRDFSFSPQELLRIVRPVANKPHDIDASAAQAIWAEQRATFTLRMKVVDQIAEIAAANENWFQPGRFDDDPKDIERRAASFVSRNQAWDIWRVLGGSKPKAEPRPASRWREVSHAAPKMAPTLSEIQHAGQVGSPQFWLNTDESWRCPGCRRSRQQIVRLNKNGEWTMPFSSRKFFNPAKRWNTEEVLTCGDCAETAQFIGKETSERFQVRGPGGYTAMVTIDEVARCVVSQPHTRHGIDSEEVEAVIEQIAERLTFLGSDAG